MFTNENTDGYTSVELAALNAELADRLASYEKGSDEYLDAVKAFSDEVAAR